MNRAENKTWNGKYSSKIRIMLLGSALSFPALLSGEEINIQGNFTPSPHQSRTPDGWGLTASGEKEAPTTVKILPKDENGIAALQIQTHPQRKQLVMLLSFKRVEVKAGDELILSGEIKGNTPLGVSYCRYNQKKENAGYAKQQNIPAAENYRNFSITLKMENTPRHEIRGASLAFMISGGAKEVFLKNLKLQVRRSPAQAASAN